MKFRSTKLIDGFSTCFRQWGATDTHCKFLHGYSISFNVTFEGKLDYRNWVMDFGFLKRSNPYKGYKIKVVDVKPTLVTKEEYYFKNIDEWFKYMFDHTTVIAYDDPSFDIFHEMDEEGIIQLRVVDSAGCERFAELVFNTLNDFLYNETMDRVRVIEVECFEHNKNSAIYTSL